MTRREYILGIDYGEKRLGLALAHTVARVPRPLETLENANGAVDAILQVIDREQVGHVVVGLPRDMHGRETAQTQIVRDFAEQLGVRLSCPLHFVDESLTSVTAEAILAERKIAYTKPEIDAMAACLILERHLDGEKA